MSKTIYSIVAALLVAVVTTGLIAMGYSQQQTAGENSNTTQQSDNNSDSARQDESNQLDEEAWLRGEDLKEAERSSPPRMLMETEKAIEQFEDRIRRMPTDPRNYIILGRLNLRYAKESDDFERFVDAEKLFKKAIQLGDEKFAAHTYLGRAYLAQHRFKEAGHVASLALQANQNNELALATLGDSAQQTGDYKTAEKAFEQLLKRSETAPLLARMARIKELMGELDKAETLLVKAADLQAASAGNASDEAWYFWRLGEFKFNQGDLAAATDYLDRALDVAPEDAHSLASLAKVQAAQGKTELALANYKKSIQLRDAPPTRLAFGEFLEGLGKFEQAEEHFQEAETAMNQEALDPLAGPAHARERAIYLLRREKDLKLALDLAQKDLSVREDSYAYDLLAWAQFKNDQHAQAANSIERALVSGLKDATVWYHAGMIHAKNGDAEKALGYLKKAIELNPYFNSKNAAQAKAMIEQMQSGG